jgi:putative ABC transport system substrate-binding protein
LRRREFIARIGGAAAAWPLPLSAQQGRVPTIGVLVFGSPPPEPFLKDLRAGLRDVGYTEGQNIRLEIRSAEGKASLLPEKAAELVRRKVDIIVPFQTPASTAAKQATSEIPIVMVRAGDPVATGLIASLARPGGNVTGTSAGVAETVGKVVELIREVIPPARRIAVLINEMDPFAKPYLAAIDAGARSVGLEIVPLMARPSGPLGPAFETMIAKRVDALIAMSFMLRSVVELALRDRVPLFSTDRLWSVAGALISYAANFEAVHRETAVYIDRILKGSKPADLPVAFPTTFELVVNLKTAKTLGLMIPQSLLLRADEVIR